MRFFIPKYEMWGMWGGQAKTKMAYGSLKLGYNKALPAGIKSAGNPHPGYGIFKWVLHYRHWNNDR
ncbi:hypothetical protein SAMN06265379_104131 [Saccharicrinis carchari]|uniref:Uncharacterized protein n=1 Tax=Saccharicrinis carchari TaxID=1168039 RepID=A0A521D1W4_SACCC|nr:hypothetical protein [Saccharicrinis carchari]SMO65676.1 hypothetical protein SAMN06265379_104131 [Saccharicrinis carchari]